MAGEKAKMDENFFPTLLVKNESGEIINQKEISTAANQGQLRDESGVFYGIKQVDNKPRVSSTPYLYDISKGNVPYHVPWTKNGYNPALSSAEQELWAVGESYVFPTAEMGMEVVSSSADDDSAGTGCRTVEIHYLDSAFNEKTEIVTMDGTNPVATVATDIYRINNFRVKTVGSGGKNAGNIDIRHLSDTPIYSRILTGLNRAMNVIYTVPKGKYLYIFNILFSAGSNVANRPVRFITKATFDSISGATVGFFMPYTNVIVTDGSVDVPIEIPTRFPEGTDVKVTVISPDGAAYGAIAMRGWLEPSS